jgi:outer membrane protein OmpA-like peptidoglycan-associated protein
MSYMSATYTDIKNAVNEADVQLLNDTVKVIFSNSVLFDFGSAYIKPNMHAAFDRFAKALNAHPKTDVLICGYTDSVGTAERNMDLSQKRADSAKTLLVYYQVKDKRMLTWGLGAKNPVMPNNTEQGRQKNRRVEFVILYDYKAGKTK